MRPIHTMPAEVRRRLQIVLTDIDDTLTEHGRLPAASYAAMERLQRSGRRIIPVTGRPAGWCDLIARQWPVDAVVGENGAFGFRYDNATRKMHRLYSRSDSQRAADKEQLQEIARRILSEIPGTALSADQEFRVADLAVDFCEDVPRLTNQAIQEIVALFEHAGATAKVSSIHVNGWFGSYDKLTMSLRTLDHFFGIDPATAKADAAFVGDSPNDAPMFGYFETSGTARACQPRRQVAQLPVKI